MWLCGRGSPDTLVRVSTGGSSRGGRRQLDRLPLVLACAVGLAAVAVIYTVLPPPEPGRAAAPGSGSDCIPLQVSSSVSKADLVAELAARYNAAGREFDGRCATVTVHAKASGAAMEALARGWDEATAGAPEPQVWLPSSSLWLHLLAGHNAAGPRAVPAPDGHPSLAHSPLVIALPRPMAVALGWPRTTLGWVEILAMSTNAEAWAQRGHTGWGQFTFGKGNPLLSGSGLAATLLMFRAVAGQAADLRSDSFAQPLMFEIVRGIESGAAHYSHDAARFLDDLLDASGRPTSALSAAFVEEQQVIRYNQRHGPDAALVAMRPRDGTLVLDHPFVVLPSSSAEQRAAADDLLAFLRSDDQQRRLMESGFRTEQTAPVAAPAPSVLWRMLADWNALRKKARVLLLVDTSDTERLDAVKRAVPRALRLLRGGDEVGVWAYPTDPGPSGQPYREVLPLTALGDGGRLTQAISSLGGGTAEAGAEGTRYETVRAARQRLVEMFDPNRISTVLVLGAGPGPTEQDADLSAPPPDRPVSVRAVPLADPRTVDAAVLAALGSF